ncbi:MAG: hypothetical protein MRZ79_19475 [Bacteroidia bacterium]|nr:hypothetical protein [Bacteroidia bacterium]
MNRIFIAGLLLTMAFFSCQPAKDSSTTTTTETWPDSLRYEQESHLKNIRQLTFGGDNAEAYWSYDNSHLVMQISNPEEGIPCDQIYFGKVPMKPGEKFEKSLVSTGKGRTTCSYFMPGNEQVIFASTHMNADSCPPGVDRAKIKKYVWPIYDSYELFISDKNGNVVKQLTDNDVYDAEATVSPMGDKVVFTSTRSGDLELYTMNIDGSDIQQITDGLGYDGGAFFSPDGSKLIFRASRPQGEEAQKEYKDLLAQGYVAPSDMELYICNVDGSDLKKITELGGANWAPFFHPSGEKVIFSSNHKSGGRTFNLFMVNLDGTGLEQITFDSVFDAFPMFSFDGKYLAFSSNRFNGGGRATNVFVAEWIE